VVRRLVGEQSFLRAACGYVLTRPPHSASLLRYGEAFPIFLRSLGDCASIEYLADIAALEWARHTARYAVHAATIPLELPQRSGARLRAVRVVLHPSVSLIDSRFPIVTIGKPIDRAAMRPSSAAGNPSRRSSQIPSALSKSGASRRADTRFSRR
jgi:hypothetical protein